MGLLLSFGTSKRGESELVGFERNQYLDEGLTCRVPSDLQLFLMVATMLFFVPGYFAHTWDWGSCSTAAPRIYHNAASLIPIFYIGLGFGLFGIVCPKVSNSAST